MQFSIVAVVLLPFLVLLGVLAKVATGIIRDLRRRQPLNHISVVGFFSGLLLIDAVLSVVAIVSAALGHSEEAKAASYWICLALFLILVAAPATALFIAVRSVRASNRDPNDSR